MICDRLITGLSDYFLLLSSVRDDLVTDDGNQALSARQGMILKNLVDSKIPIVLESAEVKVCTEDDDPVEGYEVGDRYVDFKLNTGDEEHIYILCDEIIKVVTSYEALTNLPSINGVTLSGNKSTSDLLVSYTDLSNKPSIPTATSELNNDSGFVNENDLRQMVINILNEKFEDKVSGVTITDGNLVVTTFEEDDFND